MVITRASQARDAGSIPVARSIAISNVAISGVFLFARNAERKGWALTTGKRMGKTGILLLNTGSPDAPTPDAVLEKFPEDGSNLFVVAPNFSVDCLETLYDIDIVLRRRYESEDQKLRYVACLNDSDSHVEMLKKLVKVQGETQETV